MYYILPASDVRHCRQYHCKRCHHVCTTSTRSHRALDFDIWILVAPDFHPVAHLVVQPSYRLMVLHAAADVVCLYVWRALPVLALNIAFRSVDARYTTGTPCECTASKSELQLPAHHIPRRFVRARHRSGASVARTWICKAYTSIS
jgi:hypothetical protein